MGNREHIRKAKAQKLKRKTSEENVGRNQY